MFGELPVSAEAIQAHIQRFFPLKQEKESWIQAFLLKIALAFIWRLSVNAAWNLGTFIGNCLYLINIRRDVAAVNLDIVYGDTKSAFEKNAIYRASLINFGHVIINYLRLPFKGKSFWENHFEIVNEKVLKEAINRKKGILALGGHIAMYDLGGGGAGMSGYPVSVVARRIDNPVVNRFVAEARASMNMGQIANKNTMDQIVSVLKRGEVIVLAIDQNMNKERGVFVDWMGKQASSIKSTAYIVRKTGAAVIPAITIQTGPETLQLVMGEELEWLSCPDDPEKELLMNTQNYAWAVQKNIMKYPELWLWIHKRWKIRPEGETSPYAKKPSSSGNPANR